MYIYIYTLVDGLGGIFKGRWGSLYGFCWKGPNYFDKGPLAESTSIKGLNLASI